MLIIVKANLHINVNTVNQNYKYKQLLKCKNYYIEFSGGDFDLGGSKSHLNIRSKLDLLNSVLATSGEIRAEGALNQEQASTSLNLTCK